MEIDQVENGEEFWRNFFCDPDLVSDPARLIKLNLTFDG